MKISEILHYAADHCLWEGTGKIVFSDKKQFSCDAIEQALLILFRREEVKFMYTTIIFEGLEEMGLDTTSFNFKEFPKGRERQGARYAWLKFAAMIAEEQGV